MLAHCNNRALLTAGLIVLVGAGCAIAPERATATDQSAGGTACPASQIARLSAPGDARVADFAHLLHGTWVRRLTIHGVPVETNSFWYFNMLDPEAGRGQSLMIDRVSQGPDKLAPRPAQVAPEAPATTGAYWSVSIKPAPAEPASQGHPGVTLALAGDYHGTGNDYPPNGFRFTETGTFYRHGTAYTTLHPWHAPPQATPSTGAGVPSAPDTLVDAVFITGGDADASGRGKAAWPTLTFVACQDGVVDRYVKVDDAIPVVGGKTLKTAWDAALASGMFHAEPAH